MSEVLTNTQLGLQEAQFVGEQVKPFIDAEVTASPAIKRMAEEMILHAMIDAEGTYQRTKDLITDPVKAETIAHMAKPVIDIAVESEAAHDETLKAKVETTSRLYAELDIVDDGVVYDHPDYEAVQHAEWAANDKAIQAAELANQVVDVLDKSYETDEGK